MKIHWRYFTGILLAGLICLIGLETSYISYASETLPSGLVIGDEEGLYVSSVGEYFIDLAAIQPGDRFEKVITIRSLDLEEPFDLGLLTSKKEETGPLNWNAHVTLTLTLDGEQLYEGPLLGDGSFDWSQTPLSLGTCRYGTDKILTAEFEVDSQLTTKDFLEKSTLYYYWTFVGTKHLTEPSSELPNSSSSSNSDHPRGKLPQTGEEVKGLLYRILAGLLFLLIALLLWKKGRERGGD